MKSMRTFIHRLSLFLFKLQHWKCQKSHLQVRNLNLFAPFDARVVLSLHSGLDFGWEDRFVDQEGVVVIGKLKEEEVEGIEDKL